MNRKEETQQGAPELIVGRRPTEIGGIIGSNSDGILQARSLGVLTCLLATAAGAGDKSGSVKIGVLTDMTGVFSDLTGNGSVEAAKMAIEKFGGKVNGRPVELVFADHQNKADVGLGILRRWYQV